MKGSFEQWLIANKSVDFVIMSSVMLLHQKMFRLMGYMGPHLIHWIPPLVASILFGSAVVFLMYASIAYMYVYSDNMNNATGAFYILTAMAVPCAAHINVTTNKIKVKSFFTDLADLVEERE